MTKFKYLIMIAVGVALLIWAAPAVAGGWAVITVDDLPLNVRIDEAVEISFMVRQHGFRPMQGLEPSVSAVHAGSGKEIVVLAGALEEAGHYGALIIFPETGEWEWSIQAFSMDLPMPPISVSNSSHWERRKSQERINSLRFIGFEEFLARVKSQPRKATLSQVEYGEALFVAKGCVVCHTNESVDVVEVAFQGNIGPNLTTYTAAPEFLRMWLADPNSVKMNAEMPNLELSEEEIEALIAFLNDGGKESCPVTQAPDPLFRPPAPYEEPPYERDFWYGTPALWTLLPIEGEWAGLPYHEEDGYYFQKVFWWRDGYNWLDEPLPELIVTGRRLDAPAPPLEALDATNAFASDIGSAMLTGVNFPSVGCWEITGSYGEAELSFVIWVEP